MKILLNSIRPYWTRIILGTLLSTGSGVCAILIIRMINQHMQGGIDNLEVFNFSSKFILLLVGFAGLSIISTMILARISNLIVMNLRIFISSKILSAKFEELEFKKEKLMVVLVSDIQTIAQVTDKIPGVLARSAVAIGGIVYMLTISIKLTLLISIFFVIIFSVLHITNKSLNRITSSARKTFDTIYQRFNELVYGIKELHLSGQHQKYFLESSLPEACRIHFKDKVKERINIEVTGKTSEVLMLSAIGIILVLINFHAFVPQSTFNEFLTTSLFIMAPLATLANFSKSLSSFRASLDQIEKMGLLLENEYLSKQAETEIGLAHKISYHEITYKYFNLEIDDYFKLGPLTMDISRGEITMIVGSNGSGKTTLGKIISGLYTPATGFISQDGQTISSSLNEQYRHQFGAVYTDNYLFTDLNYIMPWDSSKALKYLKLFELDHKVQIVDQKLTTKELSVGQQKRLALIIALLEKKSIYLFDEWPANQDPKFKQVFYYQILADLKKEGKTVIVITHDDKYFHLADHLYRLTEGKLEI